MTKLMVGHPRFAEPMQVALLGALYVVVARLGLMVDAVDGFATLVWPASGIALAALLAFGPRLWPGIAIGAVAANLWTGAPLLAACAIGAGNTLEAVLGAYALRRVGFEGSFDRVREVVGLVLLAALPTAAVSATVGTSALALAGVVGPDRFAFTWRAWWLGDVAGILVVAPFLVGWRPALRVPRAGRRIAEAAGLALAASATALFVFYGRPATWAEPFHQAYLVFPVLIWAALRFEQRVVTATTLLVSTMAVVAAVLGRGPFVHGGVPLHESLTHLQVFVAVAAATALVLGAAISERRRARAAIARAEEEERRRAQEIARLYEEARHAIHARDEFLSVASHELRTPLSALVLQLAALKRLFDDGQELSSAGKVGRAERATARLARLVEGLLDVSRIASGRLELSYEDCDLGEVAREALDHIGDQARLAGCELRLDVDGPVAGSWDRLRLEQILTNLLSNAIKYGPGKPVTVSVGAPGERATLSVRDLGIGISREDAERIFGRFERAVPLSHYGGLGLGLYITKQIVAEHGGSIRVTSEPGAGALFTVELPRRPARHAPRAETGSAA